MSNYEICDLIISSVAASSTFLAVIWVLFKETLLARWRAPLLQRHIRMDMPYITKNFNKYYYHLGVSNDGKSTALNCRGYIDAIYEYKEAAYERINNFIAIPISWAREDTLSTFIEPGQEKLLDLGIVDEVVDISKRQHFFKILFKGYSDTSCLYSGKYRMDIMVYSENAKRLAVSLYLNWSGVWKKQYSEMLKTLIISN